MALAKSYTFRQGANPLQLFTALQFGLLLGIIVLLATAMENWYGDEGIYLLALFSGLIDVDAITLSLSQKVKEGTPANVAILGIVIAVITNTLVKAGLFIFWAGFEKSKPLIWLIMLTSLGGIISILFWL